MKGYQLLEMVAHDEIKDGDRFIRCEYYNGVLYKEGIIEFEVDGFVWKEPFGGDCVIWTDCNVKCDWEKVEEKPHLNKLEIEICEKLLEMGYKRLKRDYPNELYAYDYYEKDPYTEKHDRIFIFSGFEFIKWHDEGSVNLNWLLEK